MKSYSISFTLSQFSEQISKKKELDFQFNAACHLKYSNFTYIENYVLQLNTNLKRKHIFKKKNFSFPQN